jgi:hypothetical protein
VAFTTYALSLSFFEAVVLDLLVRRQSAAPLIVADVDGVRSALSEYGARAWDATTKLEPVSLAGGVFHPKVTVLADAQDAHLVVGSGNLTFGGWAGNLECVEHLHPSFAADAFADAEDFFHGARRCAQVKHDALARFEALSTRLGLAAAAGPRHGRVRLLHSLARAAPRPDLGLSSELGGAQRVMVAAPYWDRDGGAVADLCRAIGSIMRTPMFIPIGMVPCRLRGDYPWASTFKLIRSRRIRCPRLPPIALHAKISKWSAREADCWSPAARMRPESAGTRRKRRSGRAAHVARAARRVELGAIRHATLRREAEAEEDGEEGEETLVLRAHLEGDLVSGLVLGNFHPGWRVRSRSPSTARRRLAWPDVNGRGAFQFEAASLELEAWKTGRLVLRLQSATRTAEGFVAFRDLQEVRRRAGQSAARLLAVMAHVDAPEDALALMSWFHEHPDALAGGERFGGGAATAAAPVIEGFTNPPRS